MDIRQLKAEIENKTLDDSVLIFKYDKPEFMFLCDHYIEEISIAKKLDKLYLESLNAINTDNEFFSTTENCPYLYIYKTDTLLDVDPSLTNVVIVCKKVSKNIPIDYIEFPSVEQWQIEDFVKFRLPGLSLDQIEWLCNICKHDFYRLDNECKKLEIFDKTMQPIIFNQMSSEGAFSDLHDLNIMTLIKAIMQKDFYTINQILSDLVNIDIEATGLCTMALKQFKSNIEISSSSKWDPTMSCTEKQFKYLKWKPNTAYTLDQMINIYEFLTELDQRLKKGELQFKNDNRPNNASYVDYIVINILTLGS